MTAHAQEAVDIAYSFLDRINEAILFPLITLLMAVALLVFLWGGFQFIMGADDPGQRTTGKQHLLWGVIGMLVMVSAYTILMIAANTFGV